mmetsp:Transcript_33150/g.48601  ORF Transcript_33150/g.48601 Transcript_33150/m.48601 type:complete len:277 (-) Transcript_33150:48-878(-)
MPKAKSHLSLSYNKNRRECGHQNPPHRRPRVVSFDNCFVFSLVPVNSAATVTDISPENLSEEKDSKRLTPIISNSRGKNNTESKGFRRSRSRGQSSNLSSLASTHDDCHGQELSSMRTVISQDQCLLKEREQTGFSFNWGQFVDIVPPEEHTQYKMYDRSLSPYLSSVCCSPWSSPCVPHPYLRSSPKLLSKRKDNPNRGAPFLGTPKNKPKINPVRYQDLEANIGRACGSKRTNTSSENTHELINHHSSTKINNEGDCMSLEEDMLERKLYDMHV